MVVADDVGLVFVTSSPSTLVLIDNKTMTEKVRVGTGTGPDGVGWDPVDKVVGVSDQGDGALSLIPNAGSGTRQQVKQECLRKVIPPGEAHLRKIVAEYVEHYHRERNHQGLGNELIESTNAHHRAIGPITCGERLGGTLRYYHREAA